MRSWIYVVLECPLSHALTIFLLKEGEKICIFFNCSKSLETSRINIACAAVGAGVQLVAAAESSYVPGITVEYANHSLHP